MESVRLNDTNTQVIKGMSLLPHVVLHDRYQVARFLHLKLRNAILLLISDRVSVASLAN